MWSNPRHRQKVHQKNKKSHKHRKSKKVTTVVIKDTDKYKDDSNSSNNKSTPTCIIIKEKNPKRNLSNFSLPQFNLSKLNFSNNNKKSDSELVPFHPKPFSGNYFESILKNDQVITYQDKDSGCKVCINPIYSY